MTDLFLPYLPINAIRSAYEAGRGNEMGSGKMASPESSAALVANTFGFFLGNRACDLPPLPGTAGFGWPALTVGLEQCCRFPWSGGEHPWLDVLVETSSHLIGIESKRYEPFRARGGIDFSDAYSRPVWGDRMGPFERVRDRLAQAALSSVHLDAAQLVKHAFGLRTEGSRRKKDPVLFYLYAEPTVWPDGRVVAAETRDAHKEEVSAFGREIAGAEVAFGSCSYCDLLAAFAQSPDRSVRDHAAAVAERFRV